MKPLPPAALEAVPARFHDLLATYWQHLSDHPEAQAALCAMFEHREGLAGELLKLWAGSDYAATLCGQRPQLLLELLESGDLERSCDDWLGRLEARAAQELQDDQASLKEFETALKRFLRRFRQREMLRVIWRDQSGRAGLEETCADMSAMADAVLQFALDRLHPWCCREMGEPRAGDGSLQQLVVIAMGKHGGRELNLSSDIDLMFAFPEGGETTVPEGLSPAPRPCAIQAFFLRLGQRLIDAIDSPTEDGFVFRVDMRLRPYGASGALALSFDAMEEYYQSQGRDWERFAMLKARVAAGDLEAGARLMTSLRPFVYRRYLDFAAIDALRDMKKLVRQQVRRKGMENNIKLGDGGIREIEFIVQVFQLIYGGRDRRLQRPGLLGALEVLAGEKYLGAGDAAELRESYVFLRDLEHCLQALRDRQTQKLPRAEEDRARVAFAMGFDDWDGLAARLAEVREVVARHFAGVIADPEEEEDVAEESEQMLALWRQELDVSRAVQLLKEMGYREPDKLLESIEAYRSSRQFLALEKIALQRLDSFMAVLLDAAAAAEDPDLAFQRVFSFMEHVTRRTAYLVLLLENRTALRQLVDLCESSPWVVECLSQYPVLLDELLKPLSAPPGREELADELRRQLLRIPEEDLDHQLDALRYFKQVHVLKVAAADLAETMPLMKVSDYLSYIAEVLLEQVLSMAWHILVKRFGPPCNSAGEAGELDFVVIAYGKLGGIELNYGSDLDLVFLHDGHPELETRAGDDQRAINSRGFYGKLGQRIINILTTTTVTGKLYEVDLRLRPSGASGLLVSSLEAYERYQHNDAWTWEHQALVRARPVAGSAALAEKFQTVRREVLSRPPDRKALRADILKMRKRMRNELGTPQGSDLFDLKQDTGGLVDIEFIVQYLVLGWACEHQDLVEFSDNMRLLEAIERNALLDSASVRALMDTYILYRSRLHRLALQNADHILPRREYAKEREIIGEIWNGVFGEDE